MSRNKFVCVSTCMYVGTYLPMISALGCVAMSVVSSIGLFAMRLGVMKRKERREGGGRVKVGQDGVNTGCVF